MYRRPRASHSRVSGVPKRLAPRNWLALFELSVTKRRSDFRRDIRDHDGAESVG